MLCYVDIEHEKVLNDPERRESRWAEDMDRKMRFEEISGQPCLIQRYTQITEERLQEWGVRALLLSGNDSDWVEYDMVTFAELFRILRGGAIPIIGFCGGMQLIALAHDTPCGPLGWLAEGVEDPHPEYHPGVIKERGFYSIDILQRDPLFDGLNDHPVMFEQHYWEVKEIPSGFVNLASTEACQIQAIKHKSRPLYGTQFHPEAYSEEHGDGKLLLANFFRLAGIR